MKIALIGDSQAEGLSLTIPVKLRAAEIELALLEHHRGWSTRRLLSNGVFERAAASEADTVIVSSGSNDSPSDSESIPAAMTTLRNKRVIWFLPGPYRSEPGETNRRAAQRKLARYPSFRDIEMPVQYLRSDGLHYNRAGYEYLADELIRLARIRSSNFIFFLLIASAFALAIFWVGK